jgi:hypothetical protein
MRIKGILILLFSLCAIADAVAQHLSHQVIVCAAGVATPPGKGYSQTIGESMVEVVRSFEHDLTQGFQQPKIKLKDDDTVVGNGVKTYPNPAIDFITVELWGEVPRSFNISIINISGVLTIREEASYDGKFWEKRRIRISDLARGFYIIRVESTDKVINRSFKLEKL